MQDISGGYSDWKALALCPKGWSFSSGLPSVHEALGLIFSIARTPNQTKTLQAPFKIVNKKLTHLKISYYWCCPEKR